MSNTLPTVTASAATRTSGTALAAMAAAARAFEPERYLAATLANEPERGAMIAIAAYASDLQRITATATEPMLGEIRLQWWRDRLDNVAAGGRSGSPLADGLADAIRTFDLPVPMLAAMSEARAFDLYDDPMPDQASLEGYLSKSEAIPFELALRVAGASAAEAGALALKAGRAFGLTRLMARLPAQLARGRRMFPGVEAANVQGMVSQYAEEVRSGLASLEPQFRRLPRAQRCALLPLATVPAYLGAILRRQRGPGRGVTDIAPLTRVWRIGLAHAMGRI